MIIQVLRHDEEGFATNLNLFCQREGLELRETPAWSTRLPAHEDYDCLVLYGGEQHVYDHQRWPWLAEELRYVARALERGKRVLGFCLGAQIIAAAMGAEVFPMPEKEVGWHEITLSVTGQRAPLFANVPPVFSSFHWHGDHFSLPRDCELLASSRASPHQAFCHAHKPLLGLQFHPEYSLELVQDFATRLGDQLWTQSRHCPGKEAIIQTTRACSDTYPLFATLLRNFLQAG